MNPKHVSLLGGAVALALLAGCGSEPKQPPAADPAAAPVVDTTPAPAAEAPMPDAMAPDAAAPAAPAVTPAAATENFADFTGNAAAGKAVFLQCQACHSLKEGDNRVGPSLYSKIGKTAGQVPGYTYSPANKNSGVVWTEENLFTYLKNPRAFMPGTKMAFGGIADAQKRADLIAFLKVNGQV